MKFVLILFKYNSYGPHTSECDTVFTLTQTRRTCILGLLILLF